MTNDELFHHLREYHRARKVRDRSEAFLRFQLTQITGLADLARCRCTPAGASGQPPAEPDVLPACHAKVCKAVEELQKATIELAGARAKLPAEFLPS